MFAKVFEKSALQIINYDLTIHQINNSYITEGDPFTCMKMENVF